MFDVLCANDNKKGQLFTLRYILHNTYIHTRKPLSAPPRPLRPRSPTIESLVNVKNHTELVFFFSVSMSYNSRCNCFNSFVVSIPRKLWKIFLCCSLSLLFLLFNIKSTRLFLLTKNQKWQKIHQRNLIFFFSCFFLLMIFKYFCRKMKKKKWKIQSGQIFNHFKLNSSYFPWFFFLEKKTLKKILNTLWKKCREKSRIWKVKKWKHQKCHSGQYYYEKYP